MTRTTRLTASALAMLAGISLANAQTPPRADPHHPGTLPPSTPAPPGAPAPVPGPGAAGRPNPMMGGDMDRMMPMMRMMHGMVASHGDRGGRMAMMPTEHVEGRIAFLKAELGVTEAQMPQWNAFADALRAGARTMRGAMASAMQAGAPTGMPARMDAMVAMMTARLESLKVTATAGKALYDVLTDAQKKLADDLIMSPMGGM